MKKIKALILLCTPFAELHVEVVDLAKEDRERILTELEGFTIISEDSRMMRAYKSGRFDVLKDDLSALLKKGWVLE
jgi:hypothetical protein